MRKYPTSYDYLALTRFHVMNWMEPFPVASM
jgi:hypothetical protein